MRLTNNLYYEKLSYFGELYSQSRCYFKKSEKNKLIGDKTRKTTPFKSANF